MRTCVLGLVLLAACGGSNSTRAAADSAAAPSAAADPAKAATPDTATSAPAPPAAQPGTAAPAQAPALRGKVVASGAENLNLTTLTVGSGPMVVLRGSLEQ